MTPSRTGGVSRFKLSRRRGDAQGPRIGRRGVRGDVRAGRGRADLDLDLDLDLDAQRTIPDGSRSPGRVDSKSRDMYVGIVRDRGRKFTWEEESDGR
jgi:hypothetical protein